MVIFNSYFDQPPRRVADDEVDLRGPVRGLCHVEPQ